MSGEEAFFKIRPTKRSNPEARTTLDALHQVQMTKMIEKEKQLEDLRHQRDECIAKLKTCNEIEQEQLQHKIRACEKEIEARSSKNEIFDQFLETSEILQNQQDIQEKIQSGAVAVLKKPVGKAKPGSVLAALEDAAKTEGVVESPVATPSSGVETLRRDKLLEQYLLKVDPEHARGTHEMDADPQGECSECGVEMIFSANEALFTCTKCGHQEFVLIDSDKPSQKDPPREVSYYAYKRINHFNEWLAQFQAKESTEIPQEVYDAILLELKKERIMDFRTLKSAKIREILKKLKQNKYQEHVPHIMNRLNGQNAPVMSREVEEKLRYMFKEIQPSFQKNCPKGRSNFLSQSQVLQKFCELLELDEYLPCFPLLKNRDKLQVQDKIWQKICEELGWEFIRSI